MQQPQSVPAAACAQETAQLSSRQPCQLPTRQLRLPCAIAFARRRVRAWCRARLQQSLLPSCLQHRRSRRSARLQQSQLVIQEGRPSCQPALCLRSSTAGSSRCHQVLWLRSRTAASSSFRSASHGWRRRAMTQRLCSWAPGPRSRPSTAAPAPSTSGLCPVSWTVADALKVRKASLHSMAHAKMPPAICLRLCHRTAMCSSSRAHLGCQAGQWGRPATGRGRGLPGAADPRLRRHRRPRAGRRVGRGVAQPPARGPHAGAAGVAGRTTALYTAAAGHRC